MNDETKINESAENNSVEQENPTVEGQVSNEQAPAPEPQQAADSQPTGDVAPEPEAEAPAAPEANEAAPVAESTPEPAAEPTASAPEPASEAAALEQSAAQAQEAAPAEEKLAPEPAEKVEEKPQELPKSSRQKHFDEVYQELKGKYEAGETIEVEVKSRIRGGLRVIYNEMPMFLPTSHYTLKRTPNEQEMQEAVGQKFNVYVHELQEYDEGRKAVIVSRRKILLEDFWGSINVGDKIEGKISSIASFGVFVEFRGVEGLIHISRLSKIHIDDPNRFYKKGEDIEAIVIDLDKDNNRIALSHKELEESPWKGCETEFPAGSQHKGIVRRLTEFGAYVELKPGVDGLLRLSELSWTKRIKKPSDLLSPGQEIPVEIISVSEEKQTASLSFKRTQPNPWHELAEKYQIGNEFNGTILQVIPQGAILSVTEEVDGFMPRSKMRRIMQGKKIPFKPGDVVEIVIADINPDEESLILAPKAEEGMEEEQGGGRERDSRPRRPRGDRMPKGAPKSTKASGNSTFSLGDLLSDKALDKLKGMDE